MVRINKLFENKKRLLLIGSAAIAIVVALFFIFFYEPKKSVPADDGLANPYAELLKTLETEQPPEDPLSRAFYYGQLGMSYQELKREDKALENYFKAQEIVDSNGLRMQYTFYQAIADVYKAKGDKQQEKKYLEEHLKYLKEYQEQVKPDDGGTTLNAIKVYEERVRNL